MAKIYNNPKEHLVIIINTEEATKLGFGIPQFGGNICICGTCNSITDDNEIYYFASLNEVMCAKCAQTYCNNINHYLDSNSVQYEIRHFNHVAAALNMKERAGTSPGGKIVIYNVEDTRYENIDVKESTDADNYLSSTEFHDLKCYNGE